MITSSPKLKQDYNITNGCLPECLDSLEKISIEDTEVYISVTDIQSQYHPGLGKLQYWYPIVEMDRWGYRVFQDFWTTLEEHWGKKIYVHCTAGVNRSRCMVYSFLKFRLRLSDEKIAEYFPVHKNLAGSYRYVSDLFAMNQREGHIPSNEKLEQLHLVLLNG